MKKSKVNGKRSENSKTKKSYFEQDIKKIEYFAGIIQAVVIVVAIAMLFYRSIIAIPLLAFIGILYFRMWVKQKACKKKEVFLSEFKEWLQILKDALRSGYSLENAIITSEKELAMIFHKPTKIRSEVVTMKRGLHLNITVEQVLATFASRVSIPEVKQFVSVFREAKRSGGNMVDIISDAILQMVEKIDTEREIQTILSAKKYEFQIMSLVPFFIIGYMGLSFPEFMQSLYKNVIGIGVMTGCLAIYLVAYLLGQKIIKIDV